MSDSDLKYLMGVYGKANKRKTHTVVKAKTGVA